MGYKLYSEEFKKKAMEDYFKNSPTIEQFCESLSVSVGAFYRWKEKYGESQNNLNTKKVIDVTGIIKPRALPSTERNVIKLRIKDIEITINETALPQVMQELKSW